jgi:diguanylate cyclase (GGDEF)-like protein
MFAMTHTSLGEARETSGATTGGLLRYVRAVAGDDAVERVLDLSGLPYSAEQLDDQATWWSYDTRIRLFEAATEVVGDPRLMFRVGAAALQSGLAHSIVILLRAMGTPRQVFRQLPRAVAKFSTTSTMEIVESGATSATIRLTLHPGFEHSRLDCIYAQGLLTTVPTVFGLPPAEIEHDECESDGAPSCVYRLTWDRRSRLPGRRREGRAKDLELTALRAQLRTLQSASTELVGSDDVDTALERIVARAAEAVIAPAYLLAVERPGGGAPLVHSAGLPADEVPALAAALLSGQDLGAHAVTVEIASARRSHGRLAAIYPTSDGVMGDEASLLAAYAGHAAAALDLIIALEGAREEAERAGALLDLAHALAAASEADAVSDLVTEALPRIVGCTSAGILLWDPAAARLRSQSSIGLSEAAHEFMLASPLNPDDTPELVGMLTDREPRIIGGTSSPALRRLLEETGISDVVAVPLLAGGTFLGVATASWQAGQAPPSLTGDVLFRLRGVGDQAATALQKARLLETVSHQATHDALTGLPNRVLFLERLVAAITAATEGAHLGVLFCDLDRFKQVNDTLGHAVGDELLRQVAARLRATVRPADTVGRLSGDEFAIILPGLVDPDDARRLAERVSECFAEPFRLEGTDIRVGTSVGVAVHDAASERTAEQLLREADAAMYRHKESGRGSVRAGA